MCHLWDLESPNGPDSHLQHALPRNRPCKYARGLNSFLNWYKQNYMFLYFNKVISEAIEDRIIYEFLISNSYMIRVWIMNSYINVEFQIVSMISYMILCIWILCVVLSRSLLVVSWYPQIHSLFSEVKHDFMNLLWISWYEFIQKRFFGVTNQCFSWIHVRNHELGPFYTRNILNHNWRISFKNIVKNCTIIQINFHWNFVDFTVL